MGFVGWVTGNPNPEPSMSSTSHLGWLKVPPAGTPQPWELGEGLFSQPCTKPQPSCFLCLPRSSSLQPGKKRGQREPKSSPSHPFPPAGSAQAVRSLECSHRASAHAKGSCALPACPCQALGTRPSPSQPVEFGFHSTEETPTGDPSPAAAPAKLSIPPAPPGASWAGLVQWEHLHACGDNSSSFHGTASRCPRDERAAPKPQINSAFAAQEELPLIQRAAQEPPRTSPQGEHLWDRATSFCAGVTSFTRFLSLGAEGRAWVFILLWMKTGKL